MLLLFIERHTSCRTPRDTDVQRRFKEHLAQGRKNSKVLFAHKPQCLAFSLPGESGALAAKVEHQFKWLSKKEK